MHRLSARLTLTLLLVSAALILAAPRPADIPFQVRLLDGGADETVAVADLNNDGRADIISGQNWYEAPGWTKHPQRDRLQFQLRR